MYTEHSSFLKVLLLFSVLVKIEPIGHSLYVRSPRSPSRNQARDGDETLSPDITMSPLHQKQIRERIHKADGPFLTYSHYVALADLESPM